MNTFLTKFLLFAPVVGIVLIQLGGVNTVISVIAAFIAALAAYLTADLVIYPRFGNLPALLLDVIITVAVLLVLSDVFKFTLSARQLALIAVLIGVGEWYYHRYLCSVLGAGRRR